MAFLPGDPLNGGGKVPGTLVLTFRDGVGRAEAERVIARQPETILIAFHETVGVASLSVPEGREDEFAEVFSNDPAVLSAERELTAELMM